MVCLDADGMAPPPGNPPAFPGKLEERPPTPMPSPLPEAPLASPLFMDPVTLWGSPVSAARLAPFPFLAVLASSPSSAALGGDSSAAAGARASAAFGLLLSVALMGDRLASVLCGTRISPFFPTVALSPLAPFGAVFMVITCSFGPWGAEVCPFPGTGSFPGTLPV